MLIRMARFFVFLCFLLCSSVSRADAGCSPEKQRSAVAEATQLRQHLRAAKIPDTDMDIPVSVQKQISQLKAALGSLDRVKQIVRLEGTMGCAPGFKDQPKVLDGASHIVNQVFGPRGRHTRMVYSNNEMPMDCATLVVLWAEIMPRDRATRFSAALWS